MRVLAAAALAGAALAGRIRAEVPVQPDRRTARAWAHEELLKREYQAERPGPLRLLATWLRQQLGRIPTPEGVNGELGLTVAVILLLVLVGYVLWRSGGVHGRARARPGAVFGEIGLTAEAHRRAAIEAEAAGDLRGALLERFRAMARSLSERALIDLTPGLTADELTRRAALRLPSLGDDLGAAARAFDDVRYGDRPATPAAVRTMRELDERALRTAPAASGTAPPAMLEAPR